MSIWLKDKNIKIIGHRGAKGLAPENTIAGIKTGIENGANIIEIDVQLSKDNELVVIHDEKVDRTTDGEGYVNQLTLKELKKLDAGVKFDNRFKGEKIPTLSEVIEFLLDYPEIYLNIEIKNGPIFYKNIEEKILNLIEKYNFNSKVIISSFDHNSLVKIKSLNAKIYTAILYIGVIFNLERYIELTNVSAIHPHYNYVNFKIVETAHNMGVAVNTWTVNKIDDWQKLIKLNVDGIATDYPNLFKF